VFYCSYIKNLGDALNKRFFKYFCEYVDSGAQDGGREFIYSRMGSVYDSISDFCAKVFREDIKKFREHIIDIDGIKISTVPAGLDGLVMSVMEGK